MSGNEEGHACSDVHKTSTAGPIWSVREMVLLFAGFLLLVVILYWRTLLTEFVYDDWLVLEELHGSGILASILRHMDPRGVLVYRPLGWGYFAVMYAMFGLSSLPFHVASFLLHALNASMVTLIGSDLIRKKLPGVLAGALFTALLSLHLETFLWFVGIYDIGALTFGLLSIVLLMRGHTYVSAAAMACALLMKEAAVFLPPLLMLWMWMTSRRLRNLELHAAVALLYASIKLLGLSPFSLPGDAAHAMAVSWSTLFDRLSTYLRWLVDGFLPFLEPNVASPLIAALCLSILVFWYLFRRSILEKTPAATIALLSLWILLALLPVICLRNLAAKYYSVHAIVPTVILGATLFSEITSRCSLTVKKALLMLLVAVISIANVEYTEAAFSRGLDQHVVNDGYFHLIKRSAAVTAIRRRLERDHHHLPHGSTVVIEGISLDAVGENRAVRLWYNDSTLHTVAASSMATDDSVKLSGMENSLVVFVDVRDSATARREGK